VSGSDNGGWNLDARGALKIAGALLFVAMLLRGSFLGFLVAGAAVVPSAYAMWLGAQEETQKTYTWGLLLFLGSLLLALILFLAWLF
jgi:hypothetical protein